MAKLIVYYACVTPLENGTLFEELYSRVSKDRQERINRFRSEKDRRLSLGVEVLFMEACKEFHLDYTKESVIRDAYGKPHFEKGFPYFNLSHSKDFVMCVMGDVPCGCDIEALGAAHPGLAKRYFHSDEMEFLNAVPQEEQSLAFYKLWTRKESFIKCIGKGLHIPLNSFSVARDIPFMRCAQTLKTYSFVEQTLEGYACCCCYETQEDPVKVEWRMKTIS